MDRGKKVARSLEVFPVDSCEEDRSTNDEDQVVPGSSESSVVDDGYVMVNAQDVPEIEEQPALISWYNSILTYSASLLLATSAEETNNDEKKEFVERKLKEITDINGEFISRRRMVKAIAKCCNCVIEDTDLSDEDLKKMISDKCICKRDYEFLTEQKRMSERMHCVFNIILLRDYRTMLVFLTYLKPDVFQKVVNEFAETSDGDNEVQHYCLWHMITSSVNIVYVAANLFTSDINTWMHVNTSAVSVIGDMKESDKIWKEVHRNLDNKPELKPAVFDAIKSSLEFCGFHSDIVKLLKEDKEQNRDSFLCNCVRRETLKCETREVQTDTYPKRDSRRAEGDPISRTVESGPSSLKRKQSEASDDDMNDSGRKKSSKDRTDSEDGTVRTNENRTGKKDSNDGLMYDNFKIGHPEYDVDEGFVSILLNSDKSIDNSESAYKDTDQTQRKSVWVNLELKASENHVPASTADSESASSSTTDDSNKTSEKDRKGFIMIKTKAKKSEDSDEVE